jgi:hypothetical protein
MRRWLFSFHYLLHFLCLLHLLALPSSADELRLKDGTKIVGTIVGFENDSFKVETSYGFALVRKDKVASIILADAKPADAAKKPAPPAAAKAESPPAAEPRPAPPRPEPMREEVDGTSYINHTFGFRLYKPPRWQVIEGARKMLPGALVAMGTSDETTLLVVSREPLRASHDEQAAATERRLRQTFENYRPLAEERLSVAGLPAIERRFRGTVDAHDWSGMIVSVARGSELYTLIGMTYADSELIQIQENVLRRAIASLEFAK